MQPTLAQSPILPGYTVQIYSAADGLPSSEILSLYQDAKDFIWIGSRGGISLFDGRRFKNYEYIGSNIVGAVYSIAEDKEGTLWISSESGLYYWNGIFFTHCSFKDEAAYLPFSAIHFTSKGDAWIGTVKGPVHLTSIQKNGEGALEKYLLPNWESIASKDGSVTFIHSSEKGVAIGAYINVYLYQHNALIKLPNPSIEREFLSDVFIDDAGIVYWNNVKSGFHYWNGKETVKPIPFNGYFFNIVFKENKMFLYSNSGIMEVEGNTKRFVKRVDLEPLKLRMPSCMLMDKEENYWAGASEGLFHIKKNEFTVHLGKEHKYLDDTYSLLRRKNGDLLIGANRGRIFIKKDSLQPYSLCPQVVKEAEVFSMYEDDEHNLWFGTGYQGIALYKNGRIKNFTTANGLPDNSHYAFYKTTTGELWSAGDMGLTRINRILKDSFTFQPFFYLKHIGYHKLYGIVEGPDGRIWAGGQLGLFYLDKDSLRPYSLPELKDKKIFVTAIKKDKNGAVWLSTRGNGILLCKFGRDNKLHLKKQWGVEEGLPVNTFLSLAFDDKNNVWSGSYSGVTAILPFAPQSFQIRNFNVKDGYINKPYQSMNMYADGEDMWTCTSSGAVSFKPAQLLKHSQKAQLYITNITLLNEKNAAEEFLVASDNDNEKTFIFPHYINSFSIEYAALYYANPEAVRYYYQLQNADGNWISTGNERAIFLRQLSPGNYRLLIKASIGGNSWTNTVSVNFQIKKPWWLQWWSIAAALIAAAFIIWHYIKSREKNVKQKEQQKTELQKLRATGYQDKLEIEQIINHFATSINSITTIDDTLWDVVKNCISKLNFEDCIIYLTDKERNVLVQKAAWGPKTKEENLPAGEVSKIVNPIEIPLGKGIVGAVAITGIAEIISDTSLDNRYIIDDINRLSEICVPIINGGNVMGVIDSEHSQRNFYTNRHLQILTTIASLCAGKIDKIQAEMQTREKEIELLTLNKNFAMSQLTALRMQMNPHFIFNALNSVQQYILQGDVVEANKYLSKFSKLQREILHCSELNFISLEKEIEILNFYLQLEQLRFGESFTYYINIADEIDETEIKIPPMMLQPFVENAIWHGLMPKQGERKLIISFDLFSDDILLATISDNGIGRDASAQLKQNNGSNTHKSKGMSMVLHRLQLLQQQYDNPFEAAVSDITDADGIVQGTQVALKIFIGNKM